MQRASPDATANILYDKLRSANSAIQIAEQRAERAERQAAEATRDAEQKLQVVRHALSASEVTRRHAEEALRVAAQPDNRRQAEVRALEMDAHEARRTARDCCGDAAAREALEEEAAFRTSVAKQARHCLQTGGAPRAVVAHVYAAPRAVATATSVQAPATTGGEDDGRDELAKLELSLALGRAVDASRTVDGIGARHAHQAASVSAQERTNNYVKAVSKDLQEGLEHEMDAYAAALRAGTQAVAR